MVGQQPLEVMLGQGEEHPSKPRSQPDADEDPSPPGFRMAQKGQGSKQAVDAGLDHDARHEGGNVAGRRWMRLGEPDVQRHETGLGSEADQGQRKCHARNRRYRSRGRQKPVKIE